MFQIYIKTWKNNNVNLYFNNFVRKIDSNNIYFNIIRLI